MLAKTLEHGFVVHRWTLSLTGPGPMQTTTACVAAPTTAGCSMFCKPNPAVPFLEISGEASGGFCGGLEEELRRGEAPAFTQGAR